MRRALFAMGVLVVVAASAHAGDADRVWDELTAEQREQVWRNYREYQKLPAERRQFLDRRYDRYRDLPPGEQRRLRKNWNRYKELEPGDRRRFNQQYREWKSKSGKRPPADKKQPGKKKKSRSGNQQR